MIRNGELNDIPRIVEMAREFWRHTIYDEEFEPESVEGMSKLCIEQGLMVVLEIDGHVCGFCCGVKGPLLASAKSFIGTEIAWWVDEDHRSGRNGIGLLIAIEKAAKEQGCRYWNMAFMESSMPESIEKIYLKMGYKKAETYYSKRFF